MTDLAGKLNSGTAKGATPLTLTLADNASSVMDAYKGMSLHLLTGAGSIQERIIASYDGPTHVATVDVRWRTNRLRYSEQLENAVWTKTGVTIDTNAIANSDGELAADALVETDQRTYQFTGSDDGWIATNATLTPGATTVVLTATAVDPQMIRTGLSFSGATFRYVTARIKRLTPGAVWEGRVYYSTAGHGFTGSYYKDILLPPGADDDFVELTWDMHALTIGGTDWKINTITGLRIDFSADNGASFEIDWISHGANFHDVAQANLSGSVDGDSMLVVAEVKPGTRVAGIQYYTEQPKLAQAGGSSTLTLAAGSSAVTDYCKGMTARLVSGAGAIQERTVIAYNGTTKVATVSPRWRTNLIENSIWDGASSGSPGTAPTSWALGFGTGTQTTLIDSIHGPENQAIKFDGDTGERVFFTNSVTIEAGKSYTLACELEAVSGGIGRLMTFNPGTATITETELLLNPSIPGRYEYKFDCTSSGTGEFRIGIGVTATLTDTVSATISAPQMEAQNSIGEYIATGASAITMPDATTYYGIIDEVPREATPGIQLYYQRRDTVANWNSTLFDFENKVIRDTSSNCEAGFEEKSDGWFLIWLKGPLNSGSTIPDFGARAVRSFDPLNTIYVGDGATIPFYLTRAQAEFRLALDGYIKTEAAAISLPDITTTYEVIDEAGEVDHLAGMQSRLPHWLRSAGNLNALLEASADPYRQLEIAFLDLRRLRAIDVASGVQLDGIGEIINVPRVPAQSDESYRYALKTAMIILTKSGEPEAVIEAYLGVTGGVLASYTEIYPATFQIATQPTVDASDPEIAAFINQTMQAIKPAGVGMILTTLDGFTLADVSEVDINNNGPTDANKGFGSSVPAETGGGGLARVI